MSNQIVISSGAKVRNLDGVLTGSTGIVSSVPLGGANGVATLDSSGKVPVSQLPASVVTYLGTWNAATNTPTLTNGVGDSGDMYICNVAGTVDFGAGPITFSVGDWVLYGSGTWQKSNGQNGTVTSVSVTESGDALTITGSPITTAGTINIGFAGTGAQYIKGDGTLATFPNTIDQAKKLITEVYNSTGATLTKGTIVYINGGQGNLPTVTKAIATGDSTSAQTYGVVQSDITNNNNGFVVVIGSLGDLDTSAYTVGTQLYLSGTTAGTWTSTKPYAPIHLVYVAIVVRSHPTQGVVEVRIQNGYELEELHDVSITSVANNQGLFYESATELWKNKSIATVLGYTPLGGDGVSGRIPYYTGTATLGNEAAFNYDANTNRLGVNTNTPNATIGANAGTDSGYSLLLKNSDTNYNGIGFGTDSTYGNLIATEKIGTALTRNLTLFNQGGYVSLTEAGNFGIGMINPNTGLDIYNGTNSYLWLHNAATGVTGTDGVRLALFSTKSANLRNFDGAFSVTAEGDFSVITLGAENIRVNSADGKVGIGAPATVPEMLTVNGSIQQTGVTSALVKTNASGKLIPAVAGSDYLTPSAISGTTNSITKFTSGSTIGNSNISDNGSLITLGSTTYVSSGNFGVGTATPAVAGVGIDIYSATSAGLRLHNAASGTTVSDGAGINFSSGLNLGITNYEAGTIDIVTNGNSGVYIASNGYVGINGATPSAALTVNGDALISSLTSNYLPKAGTGGLLGNSQFYDNGTYTAIGTNNTSFNRKLTIYSAAADSHLVLVGAAPSVRFVDNFTATYSSLFGMATATNNYIMGAVAGDFAITCNSSNSFFFGNSDGGAQRMKLTGAGDLGIGASNPDTKLDVRGEISLSYSANNGLRFYNQARSNWSSMSNTISGSSDANLVFRTANGVALTIAGTRDATFTTNIAAQAATFSSSVTATSGNFQAGTLGAFGLVLQQNSTFTFSGTAYRTALFAYNTGDGNGIQLGYDASAGTGIIAASTNGLGGATAFWTYNGSWAERMRLTKDGNVGIGTSSPSTIISGARVLQVDGSSYGFILASSGSVVAQMIGDAGGNVAFGSRSNHPMTLTTNDTERMRITSGGHVGIKVVPSSGWGSAMSALQIGTGGVLSNWTGGNNNFAVGVNYYDNGAGSLLRLYTGGTSKIDFGEDVISFSNAGSASAGSSISFTERMRITGDKVLFGTTTYAGTGVSIDGTGSAIFKYAGTGSRVMIEFINNNGTIGYINGNGSNTSYVTSSDYRLKQDLKDYNGLTLVSAIKTYDYEWKADKSRMYGVVAHELQEVLPYAVFGEKDGEQMQGVDYSKIVPVLVKAIQEQQAQIEELKQLINNK